MLALVLPLLLLLLLLMLLLLFLLTGTAIFCSLQRSGRKIADGDRSLGASCRSEARTLVRAEGVASTGAVVSSKWQDMLQQIIVPLREGKAVCTPASHAASGSHAHRSRPSGPWPRGPGQSF